LAVVHLSQDTGEVFEMGKMIITLIKGGCYPLIVPAFYGWVITYIGVLFVARKSYLLFFLF